jgi:hypothetical protein
MANHSDKCDANQMDNTQNFATNEQACASAKLSQDAYQQAPAREACPPKPEQRSEHKSDEPDHKFHGLNLGLFKIGVRNHSLSLGVNIGIAKVGAQIGQETRVDAGVNLGPVGARGGVGVGVDRHGLHSDVGGRVHAAKLVDTGAAVKANLGPKSAVYADTGAKVLFAHTRHTFDSSVGDDGFNNGYKGDVGLAKVVGVQAGGHANLNDDSSFGGRARTNLGEASLGAGADINTKNNSVINPDVHVSADSGEEKARFNVGAQVGPKLDVRAGTGYSATDRYNDYNSGEVSVGVGASGIGAQSVVQRNELHIVRKFGWGPDYMADF